MERLEVGGNYKVEVGQGKGDKEQHELDALGDELELEHEVEDNEVVLAGSDEVEAGMGENGVTLVAIRDW